MHILLIHQFYLGKNDGGGSRFNEFVKHWTTSGHKVTILAGDVNYSTGQKLRNTKKIFYIETEEENLKVIRCSVSDSYNKNFLGRLLGYFSFNISSLMAFKEVNKIDLVLVTSPPLFVGLTGIIYKLIKRKPMIFEIRDLWPESAIDTGVLKNSLIIKLSYYIEKVSYRHANYINVLTPAFKNKLIEEKGISNERVIYIPNGADTDIFKPDSNIKWVKEKYNLEDKFLITYMGAHGLANNLLSLLKVAKFLKEREPDIHFMLIGDGMKKGELLDFAANNNLTNVTFIESQPKDKIADYCNSSDLCTAVLLENDTFKTVYPNKVFDYMSCKKPILIGIDGIARKLVEENGAGVYVSPNDTLKFAQAIIELKNNPVKLKQMGENGFNFVTKNFDRKVLSKKYIMHMKRLIDVKNNI